MKIKLITLLLISNYKFLLIFLIILLFSDCKNVILIVTFSSYFNVHAFLSTRKKFSSSEKRKIVISVKQLRLHVPVVFNRDWILSKGKGNRRHVNFLSWVARETGRIDAIIVDGWISDSSIAPLVLFFFIVQQVKYEVGLCIEGEFVMIFIDYSIEWNLLQELVRVMGFLGRMRDFSRIVINENI